MNIASIKTLTFAAVGGLLLAGCASMAGGSSGATILVGGNHSKITDQTYKDVHSQADLDKLWQQAFGGMSQVPTQPSVDFSKDMVIAAFLGSEKHGGYVARITNVDNSGASLGVTVTITVPGQNCNFSQSTSEQYQFFSIPASSKPVSFNITQRNAMPCG
ncbi:MAG: hypothetical protein ACRETQ_07520 [Gammaproteobacteria bacterium]